LPQLDECANDDDRNEEDEEGPEEHPAIAETRCEVCG
jgi:hypothetical protein